MDCDPCRHHPDRPGVKLRQDRRLRFWLCQDCAELYAQLDRNDVMAAEMKRERQNAAARERANAIGVMSALAADEGEG